MDTLCIETSTTEFTMPEYGQLNATCKFPFRLKNKMYYTCTWDYSQNAGNSPWCSVDTDDNNKHHGGRDRIVIDGKKKKFFGVCDDRDACNIPPRRKCGS